MDKIKTGWQRQFFQAPNEIYDRQDISGYAKAVFVYLCRRADDESRAFPTYARIAQDVGFSLSTVRRAIETLTEIGLLIKEARYDGRGFQTSNIYTLIRPSSIPEQQHSQREEKEEGKPFLENSMLHELPQPVPLEKPGYSDGTSRVLSLDSPEGQADQLGCSVGAGRVPYKDNKEYPNNKYPVYKDQSVRQSICWVAKEVKKERLTDEQIDFSDLEQVIKFYTDKFSATRNQVIKAMISVQGQLDKGIIIMDYKAYFEKTLVQLLQDEGFQKHFV